VSQCNTCGAKIEWGFAAGRYVPLEPVATDEDLPKSFVTTDGAFRADHRERHHAGAIEVTRLRVKIPPTRVAHLFDQDDMTCGNPADPYES